MSSFGEELRRERELRQISLREISEATKVNIRYLEALERNDFSRLPGGVFNKGFVRAYAQFIGVDPEAMVNAYLLEEQAQAGPERGADPGVSRPRQRAADAREDAEGGSRPAGDRRILLFAALAIVVLVVLAVVVWILVARNRSEQDPAANRRDTSPVAREESPAPAEPAGQASHGPQTPLPGGAGGAGDPAGSPAVEEPAAEQATPSEAHEPPVEPDGAVDEAPVQPPAEAAAVVATIRVVRSTSGRVNCDNRRVEVLDRLSAGTELRFRCERFLLIGADDGGAIFLGLDGATLAPVGPDGAPVEGLRIVPEADGGSS